MTATDDEFGLPQEAPPGTGQVDHESAKFGAEICGHFKALTETLQQVIGPEFGKRCCMIMGFIGKTDEGQLLTDIRMTGNIGVGIRSCAMMLRMSAIELGLKNGKSERENLLRILAEFERHMHDIVATLPAEKGDIDSSNEV
jgi:hypothetical protein